MHKTTNIKTLQARYQRLANQLTQGHGISQGSVIERGYTRTVSGQTKHYGPYYSWTRKIDDKTITVALSEKQYRLINKAIARYRKIERTLAQMCAISEQIIFLTTTGVSKRKR